MEADFSEEQQNRQGDYVDMLKSDKSVEFLAITDYRTYFDPNNPQHTMKTICEQYSHYSGKELTLKT